jgi:3'(2'), 5'-bisphosphate nucleotidase
MIKIINKIAVEAGKIAMDYYSQSYEINIKSDESPVTQADIAVNDHICQELAKNFPTATILSEECENQEAQLKSSFKQLFIIDPIDGTEAFIQKRPEFSVNIGLVENDQFTFGSVYMPRLDLLFYNDEENAYKVVNASKKVAKTEILPKNSAQTAQIKKVAMSFRKSELQAIKDELSKFEIEEFLSPSSSYKFCIVADESADLYLRRANMKIWDVAASIAILQKTDKIIVDKNGKKLDFTALKKSLNVPHFNVGRKNILELL